MAITQQYMTLEEFLRLPEPEDEPSLEFADGEVTQKVPPQGRHSTLQPWICELVNRATRQPKLALAFSELRTTFAGLSRVPDIAVFRWDRIPATPDGKIADEFFIPPDIVIEIVSPSQSVNDLVARCVRFVENGVQAAILIDPQAESAVVFRTGAVPLSVVAPAHIDLTDVVQGLTLSVQEIFDSLAL